MKQSIIFIPLLFLTTLIIAQQNKWSLGFEFTPTISTLSGNELLESYDGIYSFSAGIVAEYQASSHISLRSGLVFERKGAKTALVFTDVNGEPWMEREVQLNYNYIVVPLIGTYSTGGRIPFYVGAGPYLGFLWNQRKTLEPFQSFPEEVEDLSDSTKKLDYGISWALGVKIPLGSRLLLDIGPRANIGMQNTSKLPVINDGEVRLNSWGLAVGIKSR